MKYRKKPIVIEAAPVTPVQREIESLASWCGGEPVGATAGGWEDMVYEGIDIVTLEGTMRADIGDYIIKGLVGEFYPCKPGIFEATYEPVDD